MRISARVVYNCVVTLALALLTAGAWLTWDLGIALLVAGGTVTTLTIYTNERVN